MGTPHGQKTHAASRISLIPAMAPTSVRQGDESILSGIHCNNFMSRTDALTALTPLTGFGRGRLFGIYARGLTLREKGICE